MVTAVNPPLPAIPLLRLRLAPHSVVPRRIDGAWWPRSYDLVAELPRLLAGLPRAWGTVDSVLVSGRMWLPLPGRMLVANQVVRLNRTPSAADVSTPAAPHTVVLLVPGRGRWDLLVVPPDTTAEAAEPLMAAAAGAAGGHG
ncbi:hypothetical protein OK074_5356 [Actinobacteria bacterium OK074]|nr:hypothetical protein OK074_5356 [Actinobacteria bacterium OK074]